MKRCYSTLLILLLSAAAFAQADNEIQVYSSPTIPKGQTIFELHSNYTFKGSKFLTDPVLARWENEALEITHGVGKNVELGFYIFTGFAPEGGYRYLGNHIRPRVAVPQEWRWPIGGSLSLEFGFFRPHEDSTFQWEGELRPIVDKAWGNFYVAFNPNIEFVLTGPNKGAGLTPQLKSVYTIEGRYGLGIEYYSSLGSFQHFLPFARQEHLLGPALDLYLSPKWEINTAFLFGLTDYSNQRIFKLLLGRRVGK